MTMYYGVGKEGLDRCSPSFPLFQANELIVSLTLCYNKLVKGVLCRPECY